MNSNLKINIIYEIKDSPWGGGNQFLKALKEEFINHKVYEDNLSKTDVILFNSHHDIKTIIKIKNKFPNKIFIHRIDGPLLKIRDTDKKTDKLIYKINNLIADGTIFQSKWSQDENIKSGLKKNRFEAIITNAPNPKIFNAYNKSKFNKNKVKLISTSWSSNWNKGFDIYQFLDNNLDFSKYQMTFIGNSPIKFKNIKHINPLNSIELAKELKKYDIFITASKNDPCSNSLIEALHCGLPAIGLDSGGHPEIIKNGGEIFHDNNDLLHKIEIVSKSYADYQKNIKIESINKIADKYYIFSQKIKKSLIDNDYSIKKINIFQRILILVKLWKKAPKIQIFKFVKNFHLL